MVNLPNSVDIDNLINDLRIFSWEAADTFIYYSSILKDPNIKSNIVKYKNNNDPVTLADLKVNELIIQRINENYKDVNWAILSEENEKLRVGDLKISSDWLWVFDPLDGTKDFIQGTGNYAMHLGLNYKNKPYMGVVLIPEKNELWFSNGERVWCERKNGSQKKTNIAVKKSLKEMTIVTSKNHRNHMLNDLIDRIKFKKKIVMGSIGCKIASILRGESDIYISLSLPGKSSPKDWDFAAPEAILKAGGGAITNLDNTELTYNKSDFSQRGIIIASNDKQNHKWICSKIKKNIEKNEPFFSLPNSEELQV